MARSGSSAVYTLEWKDLEISVQVGDILGTQADAIAVSSGSDFMLAEGVGKAVFRAAGSSLKHAMMQMKESPMYRSPMNGDAAAFVGGSLSARWVIVVVKPDKPHVRLSYRNVFKKADNEKAQSLALPGLGTGRLGVDPLFSASRAMTVIEECGTNSDFANLKKIMFVDMNAETVNVFVDQLKALAQKLTDSVLKRNGVVCHDPRVENASVVSNVPNFEKYVNAVPRDVIDGLSGDDSICPICKDTLTDISYAVVELNKCKHIFHLECIEQSFVAVRKQCPLCKMWYGPPSGNQPEGGTMQVDRCQGTVPGFPDARGYYQICYHVPGGIQAADHPRPGRRFRGTSRIAFLPDTPEGTKVLELFKLAFNYRLMFTVGDSVTTGAKDVVVWNCIHNKSSLNGGSSNFGYPDDTYLARVQEELASVGITEDML